MSKQFSRFSGGCGPDGPGAAGGAKERLTFPRVWFRRATSKGTGALNVQYGIGERRAISIGIGSLRLLGLALLCRLAIAERPSLSGGS